jgi:hypothetical protein
VAHPRPVTANAEQGLCDPKRCPSDQAHEEDVTEQAASRAALDIASGVRPEPLTRYARQNDDPRFTQDRLPKLPSDLYQGTPCSALLLAATWPTNRPPSHQEPKWKRPGGPAHPTRRPPIATTKINYKEMETVSFWDCHPRALKFGAVPASIIYNRGNTHTDQSARR